MTQQKEPPIQNVLFADPILGHVSKHNLAQMLIHVHRRSVKAGEILCHEGEKADTLYLLEEGGAVLSVAQQKVNANKQGYVGEETVLGVSEYRYTAMALQDGSIIALPTEHVGQLIVEDDSLRARFLNSFTGAKEGAGTAVDSKQEKTTASFPFRESFGWIATMVCALLAYYYGTRYGMQNDTATLLGIITSAVCMWIFQLVPEFVPPLYSVLMMILLDVVPVETALTGFTSGAFFMTMGVLGIGGLLHASGVTYRIMLYLLRILPPTRFWYGFCLFFIGLVMTPIVPSPIGRMAIMLPFLIDLMKITGAKKNDTTAAFFAISALGGVILTGAIYLTGKPINMIVYAMFDYQTQFAFQPVNWFIAASIPFLVLLSLFLIFIAMFPGKNERFSISRDVITAQLQSLGPLSRSEWSALTAVLVLGIGIITPVYHKIEIPWLILTIMVVLLLVGSVSAKDLREKIDWSTMMFIGSIVAWIPVMRATMLDQYLIDSLSWLGVYMDEQFLLFVGLLAVAIVVTRFALPLGVTAVLFATAILPLAAQLGMSLWPVGFIILLMSEAYIFPYQNPFTLQMNNELESRSLGLSSGGKRRIVRFNMLMVAVRIAAIYASIPFWRFLKIV